MTSQLFHPAIRPAVALHQTYMMSAMLLSDEPVDAQDTSSLRAAASNNGICYMHLARLLHDGTYLAKVAAAAESLPARGYTIIVTDEQIAQAWYAMSVSDEHLTMAAIAHSA